jgi:hypothetical protein
VTISCKLEAGHTTFIYLWFNVGVPLKAVRKKVSTLKLLPLLAKSGDFNYILHTFNVLPLVPKEDVVSTYEVWFWVNYKLLLDYAAP